MCLSAERPRDSILEETNMFQNPSGVGWTRVLKNHLIGHRRLPNTY